MDKKAEQIKQRIKKLNQQLLKLEEKHEKTLVRLIKDTSKKGIDMKALAGMILNAKTVAETFSKEMEVWQQAGEKFLFGSKRKTTDTKNKPSHK